MNKVYKQRLGIRRKTKLNNICHHSRYSHTGKFVKQASNLLGSLVEGNIELPISEWKEDFFSRSFTNFNFQLRNWNSSFDDKENHFISQALPMTRNNTKTFIEAAFSKISCYWVILHGLLQLFSQALYQNITPTCIDEVDFFSLSRTQFQNYWWEIRYETSAQVATPSRELRSLALLSSS